LWLGLKNINFVIHVYFAQPSVFEILRKKNMFRFPYHWLSIPSQTFLSAKEKQQNRKKNLNEKAFMQL
jgi:hypothetical protein